MAQTRLVAAGVAEAVWQASAEVKPVVREAKVSVRSAVRARSVEAEELALESAVVRSTAPSGVPAPSFTGLSSLPSSSGRLSGSGPRSLRRSAMRMSRRTDSWSRSAMW